MANFQHRPIGDLSPGDRLFAFDEYRAPEAQHRKLREAVVEAVWASRQPSFRIVTRRAEIITTADHRWLRHDGRKDWQPTRTLRIGTHLRNIEAGRPPVIDDDYRLGYLAGMTLGDGTFRYTEGQRSDKLGWPQAYWRVALADEEPLGRLVAYLTAFGIEAKTKPFSRVAENRQEMRKVEIRALGRLARLSELLRQDPGTDGYRRGFLAGFFDAEGSHGRNGIRMAQMDLGVLHRVERYGAALGFHFTVEPSTVTCPTVRLAGPMRERVRFFAEVQPAIRRKMEGLIGREADTEADEILAIESGPVVDVVDIQTSTRTFYADGVASHNCYAEIMAARFSEPGMWGHGFAEMRGGDHRWTGRVELVESQLDLPLRWRAPRCIFVNSTSDMFHEYVHDEMIDMVFGIMALCPQHIFIILTKRQKRMRAWLTFDRIEAVHRQAEDAMTHREQIEPNWPLPNVILGVSVEDQATADERIPHLLATPAAVRFVSAEPLLGPVDFNRLRRGASPLDLAMPGIDRVEAFFTSALSGQNGIRQFDGREWFTDPDAPALPCLDWIIVGSESGPGARPCDIGWVRSVRDQCGAAGVSFFWKQHIEGGRKISTPELDGRTWTEFPQITG